MSTGVPAKKNAALVFYTSLVSQADTKLLKGTPTLAAGDVQVSIDGGVFANLATLPTVTPAAGKGVKVSLSAAEMNGDDILVIFSDAAGAEWCDKSISIKTAARWIDDLAYPTTTGRSIDVSAGGEVGLDWANVGSPTTANALTGTTIATSQVVASVTGAVGSVGAGGIVAGTFAAGAIDAAALAADAGTEIGTAVWASAARTLTAAGLDSVVVETGLNARQALSIIAASGAGVLAGAATLSITIAAAGVAATNRITATVDSDGNRSAVVLAPPA